MNYVLKKTWPFVELGGLVTPATSAWQKQEVLKGVNVAVESMDVSFTNHVCNGAYKMKKDSFSEFTSAYNADAQRQYSPMFRLEFVREKGGPFRELGLLNSEYLVFRTRSVVDKGGKLISAHYGRIDSPWEFVGPGGMKLRLLMNPVVNDTNLELFLRE